MTEFERKTQAADTFWSFLAYLNKYVTVSKDLKHALADPGRTRLLSTLIEHMLPVLRADVAFVAYRNVEDDSDAWLYVPRESIKPERELQQRSPLIERMEELNWSLPHSELAMVQNGIPLVLFDQGLEKLPASFEGVVTALAISRMTLWGREYFLFFCDTQHKTRDLPRYNNFDKAMLAVSTGILEAGFVSGVRTGRRAQQDIDEQQTRQFLSGLIHELKTPIQAIAADASNLVDEMPGELEELQEIAARTLKSSRHLSRLVENFRFAISDQRASDETLVIASIDAPLREALNMLVSEVHARGIKIVGPHTVDGRPFPKLPLYYYRLTIAFNNLAHNAIVYSLPRDGEYMPIEITGCNAGENLYAIAITNYGIEITPEEIENDLLFKLKYRGKQARRYVASGSGMGLSSVKQAVNKHRGKIAVTSEPAGPGLFRNRFTIIIPTLRDPFNRGADEQDTLD
ncbi:MAG: hypothetical protein DRJ03_27210 [Chloroflexi bacterium]|nr:MAG: hypothetical protein B6I35_03125 [Anaerolineaceae bacterium 4572_32.2]RLC77239.1 MAG: hypothetical protein DRJ03_27210 [Chloroflexota bacterium]